MDKLKLSNISKQAFEMPKCNSISSKEMQHAAKELFEKGKLL